MPDPADPGDPTDPDDPGDRSGAADAPGGYAEALVELEAILVELDDDTLDVDLLATRVARAAALIAFCRDRIDGARMEVERIVADLEDDPEPD